MTQSSGCIGFGFWHRRIFDCINRRQPSDLIGGVWSVRKEREEKMMVSSFHDGPSQATTMPGVPMHMPVPMEGFHNADPSPSTGPNYQYSQHHQQQQSIRRKRKADSQETNNERLSKRLSLLNLGKIHSYICYFCCYPQLGAFPFPCIRCIDHNIHRY